MTTAAKRTGRFGLRKAYPGESRVLRATKEMAKLVLPEVVERPLRRVLAERALRRELQAVQPIDLSRVQLIRDAPLEPLRDASYLEHELLPRLGLNMEQNFTFPPSLHRFGGGLLHWQYPNQFSKYLVELSRRRIGSYLEIGLRHGGTFVITIEYLSRFRPLQRAVGVDLTLSPTLAAYAASRPGVDVIQADSQGDEFRAFVRDGEPFDLVLLDADHKEEGSRRDFETVLDRARIIVFHDIVSEQVPGVGKVWREVREAHADRFDFLEFTDQYPELCEETGMEYFGLGVAVSRSSSDGL